MFKLLYVEDKFVWNVNSKLPDCCIWYKLEMVINCKTLVDLEPKSKFKEALIADANLPNEVSD